MARLGPRVPQDSGIDRAAQPAGSALRAQIREELQRTVLREFFVGFKNLHNFQQTPCFQSSKHKGRFRCLSGCDDAPFLRASYVSRAAFLPSRPRDLDTASRHMSSQWANKVAADLKAMREVRGFSRAW